MSTPRDGSPASTRVGDVLRRAPWRAQSLAQKLSTATLHLTPAFFTITMGVGITSILLYNLPYNADWLRIIGIVIFVLNVCLFVMLCLGTVVRGVFFEGVFWASIRHPVAGMFWGTISMGLTTIVVSPSIFLYDPQRFNGIELI
jgi:tellurite resistance protein TehA-like permease